MLRKDHNASFHKTGASIFSRYRFVSGQTEARSALNRAAFDRLKAAQQDTPVLVFEADSRRRRWWLFRDEFYSDDDGFDAHEVKALLLERLSRRDRRVRRAVALMEQTDAITEAARQPIPDEVKAFVWNRDGGRCVRCASQERLEFDHVIPLALGGGNTARNLQVLCEPCNRVKGASLA
ncbi:MAG: hypothetical protein GEU75_15085 [Dehalococcoidia bacterium]|nr:hypothetical protein [Dehalococcoidia bacterium]